MELKDVRNLVMLAELGSISRTAAYVHLTPPAVHKQLKILEQELGVPLYERRGNKLVLSETAKAFVPRLKAVLSQHDAAIRWLHDWKGNSRGTVRIGTGTTMGSDLLPPLIERFHQKYAGVNLELEIGSGAGLLDRLLTGFLDVTLQPYTKAVAAVPELMVEAIWDFEIVMVTNRKGPRSCGIKALEDHPFILFSGGFPLGDLVDNHLMELGFHPRPLLRSDNAHSIRALVERGMGIAFLPIWTVYESVKSRRIRVIQLQERRLFIKVALVTRRIAYRPDWLQGFLELTKNSRWPELSAFSR